MAKSDGFDPKGLIEDAYKIDGIGAPECRSIFLDWALSYEGSAAVGVAALLARHGNEPKDHPMTQTLRQGLEPAQKPRRRGGRAGRVPE